MCGFVCLYRPQGLKEQDLPMVEKMNEIIAHRGPDDYGVYSDSKAILGFRRLSINDLANGHQPYAYDKGRLNIVFNGEIYNYRELREDLIKLGYEFVTDSEVEVIGAAYTQYGKKYVDYLRGMYAIVIRDEENDTLFACRDIFGIKPLYYTEDNDGLMLTSESKAFLFADKNIVDVNKDGLQHYLTYQFVPEPHTIYKDVMLLEPGCTLTKVGNGETKIERYFKIELKPQENDKTAMMKEIREVMEDSVRVHLTSDVPVGSFLSGGIDSTIVVALAKQHKPDIKTFTVGFEVEGYSEINLAEESAAALGVSSYKRIVTAKEYMDAFPKLVWHLDGPMADPSAVPIYFIAEEARKQVTVVLSGEGADEMFGGYTIYRESESLKMWNHVPNGLKKMFLAFSKLIPEHVKGKSFIERGCTPVEERYFGNANIFKEVQKPLILPFYNDKIKPQQITKPFYDEAKALGLDGVGKMQYIDFNTWLNGDILVKSDRMTMAHCLELRVPFLDKEVLKVASKLGRYDKIGGHTTKSLLRETFADILPDPVTTRRKLGYPVPIRVWLKNEMYDWAKDIINRSECPEYINKAEALKLLENHKAGKEDESRKIWCILSFLVWYEQVMEIVKKR